MLVYIIPFSRYDETCTISHKLNKFTHMNRFLLITTATTLFFACDNAEMEEKVDQLQAQNVTLQKEAKEKKAALASFMESFNEIEKNLQAIRAREMNVELNGQERLSFEQARKKVRKDIQQIEGLIAENRSTIKQLHTELRNSDKRKVQLSQSRIRLKEKLIAQIEERETRVNELLSELDGMESEMTNLRAAVESLQKENEEKLAEINSAYYVAGDFKALQGENIVDKEGGFLGLLGRTKTLADDFARQDKFTKIDIRKTVSLPLEGRNVKLVTTHPIDSYRLEADDATEQVNLVISDPERFWESSKYLVAVTKGS